MRHVADGRIGSRQLSEPVLWILLALAEQPRHGYALIKSIEASTSGRVTLSTGTLFGAIRRMLEDGWIAAVDLADTSRDKQAYRLTAAGRARLKDEIKRLTQLTRAAGRLRKAIS